MVAQAQYRKLSVRYHPDKCHEDASYLGDGEEGAKERFARIAEAYEALKETDGQLAFPWDQYPERQQLMPGSELIQTLGFLGFEAAQTDPIKAQFMQQVVKEATNCRVLLFEKETKEAERSVQETWADALCVDEQSGANHLVKVYRRIVTVAESVLTAAKADMEEVDD
ncbi:dnaJ [Symbiodinium natans]|uniref:DnaJ protein n=1 Tax=Symbiodinium natans TaxID=878477 RepID=A0A812I7H1_9DINO|nr:dnaJ [Symbiodinium natans]